MSNWPVETLADDLILAPVALVTSAPGVTDEAVVTDVIVVGGVAVEVIGLSVAVR